MPKASIAFQVLPKAKNDMEMIRIIDAVIALVKKSGVRYEVGPMETTMEGDLDALFSILRKAQDICIDAGARSVFTNVKILYTPSGVMTISQKVNKHRKT
jgi:uncharacterized protein YqgV (UPF0045/DUF77 family)